MTAAKKKTPKAIGAKKEKKEFKSVETWEKKSSGRWASGQSRTLEPGSTASVSKRRASSKYQALGKKVIRPRVRKQHQDKKGK